MGKAQADMIVDGCTDFGQKIIPSRFEKDEVKKVNWDLRLSLIQPNVNMKHNLLPRDFPVFKIFRFPKKYLVVGFGLT